MSAVMSGKYDLSKTAILISQTGGGCRATNYIGFIRRALTKAGHPDIPVISINMVGLEKNPGFKLTPSLIQHGLYALEFGDIFMRCLYRVRPYEKVPDLPTHYTKNGKNVSLTLLATPRFCPTVNIAKCAVRSSATLTICQ